MVAAATLWGISGVVAQRLFDTTDVTALWLVASRIIVSAALLVAWQALRHDPIRHSFSLGPRALRGRLLVFALVGLLGVQATYFLAVATGSAVTATLLQFTSPVLILLWGTLRAWQRPSLIEVVIVIAAVGGVGLVVGISPGEHVGLTAIAWGLASAVVTALYNLAPAPLYRAEPAPRVVTRAFVLGAIPMAPVLIMAWPRSLDGTGWAEVAFVAIAGTALPFALYLTALDRVVALQANIIGTLEPVVAAVVSVALGLAVASLSMGIGVALVVASVIATALTRVGHRPRHSASEPERPLR